MANSQTLLQHFTTIAGHIGRILNGLDTDMMSGSQLKLVGTIKRLVADVRLDIRDWELSDNREDMQKNAKAALGRLEQARASILLASQHDFFSPIDIAEISAQFDHIAHELHK